MSQSDRLSKVAVEYETALNLIDVVFSLECCLHHQVLPLELSDNHLVVGMVDPKNKNTIQQINPIVNSLGHSFHIQAIDTQTHQLVLAAYLKSGPKNFLSNNSTPSSKIITPTVTREKQFHPDNSPPAINHESTLIDFPEQDSSPPAINHESTLIDIPEQDNSPPPLNNKSTLIDIPEKDNSHPPLNNKSTLIDLTEESVKNSSAALTNLHERPTFIISERQESPPKNPTKSEILFSDPQINNLELDRDIVANKQKIVKQYSTLEDRVNSFERSLKLLEGLPAKDIWQALLSGIFMNEISKINLQQDNNYGRIICDGHGLVQASLDQIPLSTFEGVIKEIKMMAKLPLEKLGKNRKIAIPKTYYDKRLLLRIEFFVSKFGEEVIIRVLRGQALKFYEQKQADKTLEQAIYLAQKLEKTLKKIKICQSSADISDLRTLKIIMQKVDQQLKSIDR